MDCASTCAIQTGCPGLPIQDRFRPGFREPLVSLASRRPVRPTPRGAPLLLALHALFSRPSLVLYTPAVPRRGGAPPYSGGTSFVTGSRFLTKSTSVRSEEH